MNVFYEDGGKFKVATIVQKNDNSCQVDTLHGKRIKLKNNNIYVEFSGDMTQFLQEAENLAEEIDVDFLWEVAEKDEFSIESLAQEYYGENPTGIQIATLLICIFNAPIYFYKKGKGIFKAAPKEALDSAKASIERKKIEQEQKQAWIDELLSGKVSEPFLSDIMAILHAPEKQNLAHQAFTEAAETSKMSTLNFAKSLGLVRSVSDYLLSGFLIRQFPKGINFPNVPEAKLPNLPLSTVKAFSIDDESTTEIDDALSVEFLDNGHKKVGIHIAAPSVSIEKDSVLEKIILERLSTVYYPGNKITMLPKEWIAAFSLDEGKSKPALSLYFEVDENYIVLDVETKLELVYVTANLRTNTLEALFNHQTIPQLALSSEKMPFQDELLFLYQLSCQFLENRGQSELGQPVRYDYSIDVNQDEQVEITRRARGEPLDLLVGEMMIYANTYWAGILKDQQMPAIFRAQTSGKVRLTTEAAEHVGMGLPQYAWCTSPLRRACDYVNQKQLLSIYADYPAMFEPKDAQVFGIMRAFETTYASYATFQREIEFYYVLKYLQQEQVNQFEASYIKEGLIRATNLPLVIPVSETPDAWQGKRYLFSVKGIDLWVRSIAVHLEQISEDEKVAS